LTVATPVLAQDSKAGTSTVKIEEEGPQRLSDLGMAVNPQLGVSSFDYSEGVKEDANSKLSGGVTVEFGKGMRKMETGALVIQTAKTSYLAIPMAAKIRFAELRAQQWYGKFGFMPAFELRDDKDTNNVDVIGTIGVGGRLEFTKKSDFIIEATFNRGLMDAVRSAQGENLNQGFLVLAGMSFAI
jgi:hypothetical protein